MKIQDDFGGVHMLVREKLEDCPHFTSSEEKVAQHLLHLGLEIEDLSTGDIAKSTYTSSATVVRLAKKIGFSGWNELKENLLSETRYLNSHFKEIDPNFPFEAKDSFMTVANKIGELEIETIRDTISLLDHKVLHQVVHLLKDADTIYLFGNSVCWMLAERFKYLMVRMGKAVNVTTTLSEQRYEVVQISESDCVLFLSYSGEDDGLLGIVDSLENSKVPLISITNLGSNSVAEKCDFHLYCSTREKLSNKIGAFSSVESMNFLLDILYACIFSADYEKNLQQRLKLAKQFDAQRKSNTQQLMD